MSIADAVAEKSAGIIFAAAERLLPAIARRGKPGTVRRGGHGVRWKEAMDSGFQ
jgi:hypothetical protein